MYPNETNFPIPQTTGFVYFVQILFIAPVLGYILAYITQLLCRCFYGDYKSEMVSVNMFNTDFLS